VPPGISQPQKTQDPQGSQPYPFGPSPGCGSEEEPAQQERLACVGGALRWFHLVLAVVGNAEYEGRRHQVEADRQVGIGNGGMAEDQWHRSQQQSRQAGDPARHSFPYQEGIDGEQQRQIIAAKGQLGGWQGLAKQGFERRDQQGDVQRVDDRIRAPGLDVSQRACGGNAVTLDPPQHDLVRREIAFAGTNERCQPGDEKDCYKPGIKPFYLASGRIGYHRRVKGGGMGVYRWLSAPEPGEGEAEEQQQASRPKECSLP